MAARGVPPEPLQIQKVKIMKPSFISINALRGLLLSGLLLLTAFAAPASVVTLPSGLNPGDPYRLIFVTLVGINATAGTFANPLFPLLGSPLQGISRSR
jgi:hypothetical protein